MSREEDLIRSATRAIAATVREVPPLRLGPAGDELRSPARAPRRAPGGGQRRYWRSWLPPLTAAVVVTAIAIVLVLVRDIPNGGVVSPTPVASTSPAGVPRYYAAIQQPDGKSNTSRQLVVGDSLIGTVLATIAPPAGVTFGSVTGAADDRTFVVQAVAGSGSASVREWFELHLALGTAHQVTMTPSPVKPQPVPALSPLPAAELATSFPSALSAAGRELAVAEVTSTGGMAVKVFSVATGRLLHDWTTNDPSLSVTGAGPGLGLAPALTWVDGDRALALSAISVATRSGTVAVERQTVRRLNVGGPASGDLIADSTVIRDVQVGGHSTPQASCGDLYDWPPLVSPDGKTFTCSSLGTFFTFPLTDSATADKGRTDNPPATAINEAAKGIFVSGVLWTSPSGDVLIAEAGQSQDSYGPTAGAGLQIGVLSQRKFTPLRFPPDFNPVTAVWIAW